MDISTRPTSLPSDDASGDKGNPLRVLVIDDSKTARFAMRKYLERLSYQVETVSSATEAYRLLEDHMPDVIFLDNIMPGINGMEVLSALQNNRTTAVIPIIFCTSIENSEFITNALEHGARNVLHKPPSIDDISRILLNVGENLPQKPAANSAFIPAPHVEPRATAVESIAATTKEEIQSQIDEAVKKLRNELMVQLSELQAQLSTFDTHGVSPEEVEAFREIAREEAASLNEALRTEMEAIHRRLDQIAVSQLQTIHKTFNV